MKSNRRSQITRMIVTQYIRALIGFVVVFVGLVLIAWVYCRSIIWQPDDPVYQILSFIQKWIVLFIVLPTIGIWTLITYYYMDKPLRYLDEVVTASESLITTKDSPIELPEAMKSVQDELNLFREQSLRSDLIAKEAEQRKNDLIVYLAHDLKTPLTSVIGYLTLLRDEPQLSAELRERYTGIALDKAERLEYLINEFFDITRFNLTTLTLEPERTNLSRMLDQITYEFNPILLEKELTWRIEITPEVEIVCDRDKLGRVFDNLIRNAVNYSYTQTEITLTMKPINSSVQITIVNHGKTISSDKLERIFEQFFRLDSSRSSTTGGAGLGLAISKEIIELHGGSIHAASENEKISLTVVLPVHCH